MNGRLVGLFEGGMDCVELNMGFKHRQRTGRFSEQSTLSFPSSGSVIWPPAQ